MSYFSEYPENKYLMMCLCAHCHNYMLVNLEKDNIHKCICQKCGKYNRIIDVGYNNEGSLDGVVLKFNEED